jgi:tetratricopeptide (TPR) repeat protein
VKKHILSKTLLSAAALIGGLVLYSCGAGGGAAELTTARQAMSKAEKDKSVLAFVKDPVKKAKSQDDITGLYKTAYANLQTEVLKGSTSANIGEAWFLLGKVSKELGNTDSMNIAFKQADKLLADDKLGKQARSEMGGYMFEGWASGFNKGVEQYNAGVAMDDEKAKVAKLKEAAETLSNAAAMKPENADIYPIIAGAYQGSGDTVKALATYEKYIEFHQPAVSALTSRGVLLGQERAEALQKLGAPASSKGVAAQPDTVVMDKYMLDGKELSVYYPRNKDGKFVLEGFKPALPAAWADYERDRYYAYNNQINYFVAYNYYTQKNWDKALKYTDNGLLLNPGNEELLNLQAAIYTEGGKLEQAMASYKERIAKNPNDKNSLVQYGSMLSNAGKLDESIDIFKKVLAVDPQSDIATFNLAAALKNKASAIQKEEQDKFDKADAARKKDKKAPEYKMDNTKYFPYLKQSAEYFEKYRKLPGKDRDLNVLDQLINTYDVVDDKEGYRNAAGQFAGLEYANEKNPRFYETMARIYGKQKKNDKVKEALDKADALRKAGAK